MGPASSPLAKSPAYRPEIDGLRAFAVASVAAYHAFPALLPGGFVGVDVFFVLSGFLISRIVADGVHSGTFTFAGFYQRRARRIFPALALVLAATLAFGWVVLFSEELRELGKHVLAGAGFSANLADWDEAGYFDRSTETKPLAHLWSLGIEEQFYAAWPLLLVVAAKARARLPWVAAALACASFSAGLFATAGDPVGAFFLPQHRIWELLAGAVLALSSAALPAGGPSRARADLAAWLGAGLLAVSVAALSASQPFPGWRALAPCSGTLLLLWAGQRAWLGRAVLSHPLAVFGGLVSYPLYLWHWPLLVYARILSGGTPPAPVRAAALSASLLLAWATYRWVESPLRFGRRGCAKAFGLAAALAATGFAGAWTYGYHPAQGEERALDRTAAGLAAPRQTRVSDRSCRTHLGLAPPTEWVCLARSAHPEVLIAGDSHAMSLASAAVMGEVKLDTLLLAAHTCLPFTGYTVGAGPVADEACQQMTALALDLAGRLASLRTVVLATRGPYYFSGAGFGAEGPNQNRLAPRSDPAARIPQDKAFVDGWVAAIASLLRTGKRVVFAIDAPELGVDPRDCLPRPLSAGAALRNCVVPRALVDERQRRYRALVGQIAARSPGLLVYDPTSLFCSSEACYGVRDGRLLYFDRDHPSVAASALVLEDLRSWLERQPRPAAP